MGASIGTGGGKSLDVEINVVPFIDLMSCLTAFLLVTAVWVNFAQIPIKPKGLSREAQKEMIEEPPVNASVLVTKNELWVGLTMGDRLRIPVKQNAQHDWEAMAEALKGFKSLSIFETREDIEIAGEDDVDYQNVIRAMDFAVSAGFNDIGFVDPGSLSVKFKE
jgi:biopolymer transport protein ExbD